MKKKALTAVLCICLAFLLFSCEGSLTATIDKFLSVADGNVYINAGLIDVDTSQVGAAMEQITSGSTLETVTDESGSSTAQIGSSVQIKIDNENNTTVSVAGQNVNITGTNLKGENPTFAAPLEKDKLDELNTTLGAVLSSPQKKEALVEELKKPVEDESKEATQNTFALTAAIADSMAQQDGIDDSVKSVLNDLTEMANAMTADDATVTQSDVLTAQLVVGIASDIATLSTSSDISDEDKADLTARILDQANTMINIANTETGSFDVTKIDGLMDILGGSSKSISLSNDSLRSQIVKYRPVLNAVAKDLLGYNGSFDEARVNRIIDCYKKAEIAQRLVLTNDDLRAAKGFDLDSTLKYAVAVFVSTLDGLNNVDGYTPTSALTELIKDNPWILADGNGNFVAIDENTELIISEKLQNAIMDEKHKLIDGDVISKTTLMSQAQALDNVIGNIPSLPEGFSLVDKLGSLYN
jgi:hypothetical protein